MPDTPEDKQHECLSSTPLPCCSGPAAQQHVSDADEKYLHLFEHLIDGAFLADAESGIIIEANDRAADLVGRPREDIIGLHQTALHPPGQREKYRQIFFRHVQAGTAVNLDAEIIRSDGKIIPVLISGSVFSCSGRKLILGIFRDITEKKLDRERLLLSQFFSA